MPKLSAKHKAFAKALLKHKFNQTAAYMAVYPNCSKEAARNHGSKLVAKGSIQEYLSKLNEKVDQKLLFSVEDTIKGTAEIYEKCSQKKSIQKYDPETNTYKDVKLFEPKSALKALELLGKYNASFKDRLVHEGEIQGLDREKLESMKKATKKK